MSAIVERVPAVARQGAWMKYNPWVIGVVAIALLFSIPLLTVVGSFLFPAGDIWKHLYSTVLSDYIINSLILMSGVGVLTAILGITPAWLITMYRFPCSRILDWALLLPMAIPAYIIAYTYTGMLDVAGPVQSWIREITGWK